MSVASSPGQNQVLAALTEDCYARLLSYLEPTEMPFAKVLYDSDTEFSHVYFPTTSIVSMLHVSDDTACAGIAMVGSEGLVGPALFIGEAAMPNRAIVQCSGEGYRMDSRLLKGEMARAGRVLDLLLIHTRVLIAQMANTAACNRRHSLEQRFCRWLLSILHHHGPTRVGMTAQLLAEVLGTRCESIDPLVRQLGDDGLIGYGSHWVEVRDRARVEARTCECYASLTMEVEQLLTRSSQT